MLRLNDMGYGRKKGIASTMVVACTFDNIFNLVCFGITRTVTFLLAAKAMGKVGKDPNLTIGFLFVQVLGGFFGGISMGLFSWNFKLI